MTRRDKCFKVAERALKLEGEQAVLAWRALSVELEGMSEMDVPRFKHLLNAVYRATIAGEFLFRVQDPTRNPSPASQD